MTVVQCENVVPAGLLSQEILLSDGVWTVFLLVLTTETLAAFCVLFIIW